MSNVDRFRMTARGPNGQLKIIRFEMLAEDQRAPNVVGCAYLDDTTGIRGWTALTVEWLNRPGRRTA